MFKSLFGPQIPHLDATAAQARLKDNSKPFLLDVREPDEYRDGHIPGATLIPLGELPRRVNELPRDREILVVCHSGSRSGAATRHLLSQGFKAVNVAGGMMQWARAGLAVKRGSAK